MNFLLILTCVSLGSAGQILLKLGINSANATGPIATASILQKMMAYLASPLVLLGIMSYAVSMLVWIYLLSRVPVSWAYPFLGLTYFAVIVLSAIFLGERITPLHILGTAFIWVGVFLLYRVPV